MCVVPGQLTRALRVAATVLALSTHAFAQAAQVASLAEQLRSPNAGLRAQAAMSLGELGVSAKAAVPALATALADRNLNVRYFAATALSAVGPEARAAVPALIAALKTFPGGTPELDGPARYFPDVRNVAAEALGAIGPAARAALPALTQAKSDKDGSVSAAATAAIKKIAGN